MRTSLVPSILLSTSLALAACAGEHGASNEKGAGAPSASTPSPSSDPARAIAEADIIQQREGVLYALSKSGSVSLVDISRQGELRMIGQTKVLGQPFEMYLRGSTLLVMANGARLDPSVQRAPSTQDIYYYDDTASAALQAVDLRDPAHPFVGRSYDVAGEVADSRVVGDVLYLATYENARCYGCGQKPLTRVSSFDIKDAQLPTLIDQVDLESTAPDAYNLPWGQNWKRSIFVTAQRLYIGGHADVAPDGYAPDTKEGIIDVLDISDGAGKLVRGARLEVAGAILSRWQLDEADGVLRVVSQRGAGRTGNGVAPPEVETFRVFSSRSFIPVGNLRMKLPRPEGLRAVRFDGQRAYAITYNQTDPLFVLDLSVPEQPKQRGELFMPGFMYHLEPHGDRVIGLGIDRTDPEGSLNVSLFDVANADEPLLLARASFGPVHLTEDYEILNAEVAEDQDRIQKAFRVLSNGLVVVPFSAPRRYYDAEDCGNAGGGVQLVEWKQDELAKKALLPLPGNPRRALENGRELLVVSDSNVRAYSLADVSLVQPTADLVIGECVPRDAYGYGYGGYLEEDGPYHRHGFFGCAAAPGGAQSGILGLVVLALALGARRRRRAPA